MITTRMSIDDMVFVFGSNSASRHGAGAARYAVLYKGAINGKTGLVGQSYGIDTKDHNIQTLPLLNVEQNVYKFIEFAKLHPDTKFQVTRIGCGLAGFVDADIAPMFVNAPLNCYFDIAWSGWLGNKYQYWGTFE